MKFDEIILLVAEYLTLMFFCVMATSCRTQDCVPQIEYVKQDSIITRIKIDSVSVREKDSVFIDRAGDTIYLMRYKYVYKDRIKNKVDTIYQDKVREIVQTQRITERYTPPFYRFTMWFFWIVVVLIVLWVGWRVYRAVQHI